MSTLMQFSTISTFTMRIVEMTNVLILAAGNPPGERESDGYPLCLTDVEGKPLLERILESCKALQNPRFLIAFQLTEIRRFFLDNIVQLLTDRHCKTIGVENETCGAACTALLASEYIDNDEELLILNANELLFIDFKHTLDSFRLRGLDAGVVIFQSVHPRYSYVRLDQDGYVVEAAEKRPISRNATAGFYWYAKGSEFVTAAKMMIRKNASIADMFYICPVFNELVLLNRRIGVSKIGNEQYLPLKTDRQFEKQEVTREKMGQNESQLPRFSN